MSPQAPWLFAPPHSQPHIACRCPCGAFRAAVLQPLEPRSGGRQNPFACCLPLSESPDCPVDCAALVASLSDWAALGHVPAETMSGGHAIRWAWTTADALEVDPLSPLRTVQASNGLIAGGWTAMQCAGCGYLTHAKRGNQVALVCNLGRHSKPGPT